MADLTRVRDPLEIAAASPDPVVRRMAMQRKALDEEKRRLDTFFDIYGSEPEPAKPVQPDRPARARPPSAPPPAAQEIDTGAVVEHVLTQTGPLGLDDLYVRFKEASGSGMSKESFRQALHRRAGRFPRVSAEDRRYWMAGAPLPAGSVVS